MALHAEKGRDEKVMTPAFVFTPPHPALRGLIREHQIIRLRFEPGVVVPVKAYWPRPACALAFYPRDRERISGLDQGPSWEKPRSAIIGQPTTVTWRQVGHDYLVYQIELQPGALFRLTGVPVHRFQDEHIDAEAVMPKGFREVADAIEDATSPAHMIAIAESYFLSKIHKVQAEAPVDRLAQRVLANPDRDIDSLAARASLSPRQMRRLFQDRIGAGAKMMARIARFDRVIRLRNAQPETDWLELAILGGYADHQHMARDFRAFTGVSPTVFATLENNAPEREFGFKET
jgi:AraC-like DNA-binding protein